METRIASQLSVEIEKPSSILRKMTVKVPAQLVKKHFDRGLVAVQKTANLKGFRPGHAPIGMIKQHYGEDVRHRVFHNLIDESFEKAVQENQFRTVGKPQIDTPDHKTGEGSHDHTLHEEKDLTFIATFEVMPEFEAKNYTGIALTQDSVEVTAEDVQKVVDSLHQSQGQLVPLGTDSQRPAQKLDFADVKMSGGMVTESGIQSREDLTGNRLIELGSGEWLPGFGENLIGMSCGETKTFRMTFPQEESLGDLSGKEAEFCVTLNELKLKNLPVLDDELAKQMGFDSLEKLRTQAQVHLLKQKKEESEQKLKSALLSQLIDNNPFEVPTVLVEAQARGLAQDLVQEFKKQGYDDAVIQNAITQDLNQLFKRAEAQVRSSLVLESVAKIETISITPEDIEAEMNRVAESMEIERSTLDEFYAKKPGKKGELEFRLRQERTLKFVLDNAKVKSVSA